MPIGMLIMLVIVLALTVFFDMRYRRIPNLAVFGALGFFLFLHALVGTFFPAVIGFFVAASIGFIAWSLRVIGGGDQKLLMAVGAAVGYPMIVSVLFAIAIVGGLEAVVFLVRATPRPFTWGSLRDVARRVFIPYSIAIAMGTIIGAVAPSFTSNPPL